LLENSKNCEIKSHNYIFFIQWPKQPSSFQLKKKKNFPRRYITYMIKNRTEIVWKMNEFYREFLCFPDLKKVLDKRIHKVDFRSMGTVEVTVKRPEDTKSKKIKPQVLPKPKLEKSALLKSQPTPANQVILLSVIIYELLSIKHLHYI